MEIGTQLDSTFPKTCHISTFGIFEVKFAVSAHCPELLIMKSDGVYFATRFPSFFISKTFENLSDHFSNYVRSQTFVCIIIWQLLIIFVFVYRLR